MIAPFFQDCFSLSFLLLTPAFSSFLLVGRAPQFKRGGCWSGLGLEETGWVRISLRSGPQALRSGPQPDRKPCYLRSGPQGNFPPTLRLRTSTQILNTGTRDATQLQTWWANTGQRADERVRKACGPDRKSSNFTPGRRVSRSVGPWTSTQEHRDREAPATGVTIQLSR